MIKAIFFDLDGVLVDAKKIHFDTLNKALASMGDEYIISESEHLSIFDGLKTQEKLNILSKIKKLDPSLHKKIWSLKQQFTEGEINQLSNDYKLIEMFKQLKKEGYILACCSNSIRRSVFIMLSKIGIIEYMDLILSNEDVSISKPHPEIYWRAMTLLNLYPEECVIVEDSPNGLLAAQRSSCKTLRVKNSQDLNIEKLHKFINKTKSNMNTKWQDNKLNVLIPMAGAGSRFEKAGYTFPKPLIDVNGKPMIQVVVNNLGFESPHTFIVQKSHREKYNLDSMLSIISNNCNIIEVDGITEGAACTTLLAKDLINNDNPLIIANSDQYVEWNTSEFMYKMQEQDADAGILTFRSTHPKWSFVKVDENNFVTEVAEKNPISDIATVGIYFWKKGSDYVKYAEQMISKNIRFNNEFYVCPVFNQAIEDGKKIKIFEIEKMWGIGTPEDLNSFLENHINKE
jgi:HAD superfamily hydrolase (TIGR01509 family)